MLVKADAKRATKVRKRERGARSNKRKRKGGDVEGMGRERERERERERDRETERAWRDGTNRGGKEWKGVEKKYAEGEEE